MSTDENSVSLDKKLSASALAGLIIGSIGILLSAVPIINNFAAVLAVVGLVFGIIGLIGVKKGKRRGRGIAIAAIILSILAFVIVIASQSFYSSTLNEASKEMEKSIDKASGDATADILGKDVDVQLGEFVATTDEYGLVSTLLTVTTKNKLPEAKTYTIKIEAVDTNGNRVADDTVYADKLGAGQTQVLEAFKLVESTKVDALKTATFKIVSVSEM